MYGRLTINQTCWAGIGFSSDGTMNNAGAFLIGTADPKDPDMGLVALYYTNHSATAGHTMPTWNSTQSDLVSHAQGRARPSCPGRRRFVSARPSPLHVPNPAASPQ